MSKHGADDPNAGQPPIKKVYFEPHLIGPVSTLEEMNIKVLQFQNKKLAQRIEQRMRTETELRHRIEQLEKRQTQDDAVLNVVNRYWNQLNEDVRVLLQRFDAETADEFENKNENEATTSFLVQLSTWDKEELNDKLAQRVQVSKRAVAKIVQVIDRLMQRNEKISQCLKDGGDNGEMLKISQIDDILRQSQVEIMAENRSLHNLNTSLHEKFHTISLKMKEYQDTLTAKETESAELRNQIDELQYDLEKVRCRKDKLENHLAEAIEKLKANHQMYGDATKNVGKIIATTNVNSQHLEDLQKDLEEYRELANNRLLELDKLHQTHRQTLKEVEKLKMDIHQLPESVIVETTEYKCLQSQFSVLYNESMQIKTMLDETRNQLQINKNQHLRQIEIMESKELSAQSKVRSEMIQMEDVLAQIRKEYEMLQIKFEENIDANELTAPINREMRHLIKSLQNRNGQLKDDVQRYKTKYKDISGDNIKLRKELDEAIAKAEAANTRLADDVREEGVIKEEISSDRSASVKEEITASQVNTELDKNDEDSKDNTDGIKQEKDTTEASSKGEKKELIQDANAIKAKKDPKEQRIKEMKIAESEIIRDMKVQLKKAMNDQKELKLLLDMHKGVSKEQRDKVQLMVAEKKLRSETDELRQQLKKMQETKCEEGKLLADKKLFRKIKQLEEQKYELQKQVASQNQVNGPWPFVGPHEEEILLNEMEVTGQAFEDMQEQNSRLIQQLREKDDANFKLMTDRIKANQIHKLLREENQILEDQVATRNRQIETMHIVLRKLEEKERYLQNTVTTIDKELVLRQQAMEMHKRKAIESVQSAADLKLHLEKYHLQMKEAQQVVAEKTSSLEAEAYKTKRLQDELSQFKRKAERMKKIEMTGTTIDEVMLEEIREYKETLTCPSCKVKRKDTVLSKCFHVFCYDCLRTRYETRQRKCPECNCAFGANDYHRLYLSS